MTAVAAHVRVISTHYRLAVDREVVHPFEEECVVRLRIAQHDHITHTSGQPTEDEHTVAGPQRGLHAGVGDDEAANGKVRHGPGCRLNT